METDKISYNLKLLEYVSRSNSIQIHEYSNIWDIDLYLCIQAYSLRLKYIRISLGIKSF